MELPRIIQGGMGVGVSGWKLARAVSTLGHLGVVSGTGINSTFVRRLQDGDPDGSLRRAMKAFPDQEVVDEAMRLYFEPGGRKPGAPYKLCPMPSLHPSPWFLRSMILASFAEVSLAKEGHFGLVGINLLEKLQLSNLPCLYGAMLAGVDYVLMGAGIPRAIPGALDRMAEGLSASLKIDNDLEIEFDPSKVLFQGPAPRLARPRFLAIVSSATLAAHLAKKTTGRVDGFVIETHTAGGHNAPPRGALRLSESGEPIYDEKDQIDFEALRRLGLPFWLAGSFGNPEQARRARELGAQGVQVGTAFAFCEESGFTSELKRKVLEQWGAPEHRSTARVFTDPSASPTGFPFKVVPMPGTLSDDEVYASRERKCDLGYLRTAAKLTDGTVVYRCPAEPVADYLRKGGALSETVGRKCLCNSLMSDIGLAQLRSNGEVEPSLITAGDDVTELWRFLPQGATSYRAQDVIRVLTAPTQ